MNVIMPMERGVQSLIAQYSAGSLGAGMNVLVASFLTLSPRYRSYVADFEAINGELLDREAPVDLSEGALDALMGRLDNEDAARSNGADILSVADNDDIPASLRAYLPASLEDMQWRFAYPGVKTCDLPIGSGEETVQLLRIEPGKAAPRHTHDGTEATLVLRGAFRDGKDLYERGEISVADGHVVHRPRAEGDEICYCLAVSDGNLKLSQSFVRIFRDFFV